MSNIYDTSMWASFSEIKQAYKIAWESIFSRFNFATVSHTGIVTLHESRPVYCERTGWTKQLDSCADLNRASSHLAVIILNISHIVGDRSLHIFERDNTDTQIWAKARERIHGS